MLNPRNSPIVMARLDPAIHPFAKSFLRRMMDHPNSLRHRRRCDPAGEEHQALAARMEGRSHSLDESGLARPLRRDRPVVRYETEPSPPSCPGLTRPSISFAKPSHEE